MPRFAELAPEPAAKTRFDRLTILFHWATVLLLIAAFALIEMRVLFERGTPIRVAVKEWHYVTGVLILLMTCARLAHRLGRKSVHPPITPAVPRWQDLLARAMHWVLYAVLIILPLMGLLTTSALGDPVNIGFGLQLPALMAPNPELGEWLEHQHGFMGDVLYVLIGGHALAGLVHHYLQRDNTLLRMMPQKARDHQTEPHANS